MAVSKRELTLDLLARDKTKQATDSAAKNLGGVADAADDAAKSTDRLSKSAKQNADRLDKLDREAHLAKRELESLARAFADTEDAAERADLAKGIRALENELRKLGKNKSILEGILPDDPEPAGRSFGKKLVGAIASGGGAVASLAGNKVGITIGVAAGAAAAPVLVSAIGSALAAGAGAGVLGVGIMSAVKADAQIQAAGKTAGQRFMKGLTDAAHGPLKGPILDSLEVLSAAGDRTNQRLSRAFASLSDDLTPFTRKIVGAGEAVSGSLIASAEESGPALDGLGDSVAMLGRGIGNFVDVVADGGPEAADNLRLVAGATSDLVTATGNFLGVLNKAANNEWLTGPVIPLLRKHYAELADESEAVVPHVQALTDRIRRQQEAAAAASMTLDEMAAALDKVTDAQRSLYGAEVDAAVAIEENTKKIVENGRGLDLNTEKGRANRQALLGLAEALARDNQAYTAVNGVSEKTTRHMEGNRAAFVRAAQAAGYNASEARKLADRLLGIPVKTEPRVSMKGAGKAIGDARTLNRLVRDFQGVYTATMITNYVRHGKPGTGGGLATGGQVEGPGTTTSDSVPMMLSRKEFVVRAAVVQKPGVLAALQNLNAGGSGYGLTPGAGGGMTRGGWSGQSAMPAAQPVVRLELGGDREIVALFRRLIRTHNLLQTS